MRTSTEVEEEFHAFSWISVSQPVHRDPNLSHEDIPSASRNNNVQDYFLNNNKLEEHFIEL
jgi:hypothetical protein